MKTNAADYLKLPYTVTIRPQPDGSGFIARVDELPGCLADGDTETEALGAVREVQQAWVEEALEIGRPIPEPVAERHIPSGKWIQRVSRTLHGKLVELAASEHVSLNQLVTTILAEAVGERKAHVKSAQTANVRAVTYISAHDCIESWRNPNVMWVGSGKPMSSAVGYQSLLYGQLPREITQTEEFDAEIIPSEGEQELRRLSEESRTVVHGTSPIRRTR